MALLPRQAVYLLKAPFISYLYVLLKPACAVKAQTQAMRVMVLVRCMVFRASGQCFLVSTQAPSNIGLLNLIHWQRIHPQLGFVSINLATNV